MARLRLDPEGVGFGVVLLPLQPDVWRLCRSGELSLDLFSRPVWTDEGTGRRFDDYCRSVRQFSTAGRRTPRRSLGRLPDATVSAHRNFGLPERRRDVAGGVRRRCAPDIRDGDAWHGKW